MAAALADVARRSNVDDIFVLLSPWSTGLVLALLWSQLSKNPSEKKFRVEIS
jgi:hypothetical protein